MATRSQIINSFCNGANKGKASSLSIEKTPKGTALYSYATPIAYRDDKGNIFMTKKKFSPTTSTQQNALRRECYSKEIGTSYAKELDNDKYKDKLSKESVSYSYSRL